MKRRLPQPLSRAVRLLSLALAGALSAAAAAGGGTSDPAAAAAATAAGAGADPAAIQAGRKLFLRHCAECHGEEARGSRRAPALDSQRVRQAPAEDLFWFVTNGNLRTGMPSWSRLPAARRWQILAYLRSLPAPPGPPAANGGPHVQGGHAARP
jgi:mono/diheme cytochrome c family protein